MSLRPNFIHAGTPEQASLFQDTASAASRANGRDVVLVHTGLWPETMDPVAVDMAQVGPEGPFIVTDLIFMRAPDRRLWLVPQDIGPYVEVRGDGLALVTEPPFLTQDERCDGVCRAAAEICGSSRAGGDADMAMSLPSRCKAATTPLKADQADPQSWLYLNPAGPSSAGLVFGVLRKPYGGRTNSALEFGWRKSHLGHGPDAADFSAWSPNVERVEVVLPPRADDMLADPAILLGQMDASSPECDKALLVKAARGPPR